MISLDVAKETNKTQNICHSDSGCLAFGEESHIRGWKETALCYWRGHGKLPSNTLVFLCYWQCFSSQWESLRKPAGWWNTFSHFSRWQKIYVWSFPPTPTSLLILRKLIETIWDCPTLDEPTQITKYFLSTHSTVRINTWYLF